MARMEMITISLEEKKMDESVNITRRFVAGGA